jgi:hypothetical protein
VISVKQGISTIAGTVALIGIFQVACTDSRQAIDDELAVRETLATFIRAFEDGRALSRRTFVLAREEGSWKIVHLHASNVVSSE